MKKIKYQLIIILFITLYVNIEAVHVELFSDNKYKYDYNFFAPVARKINDIFHSNLEEIDTTEYVEWYVKDLTTYFKAILLAIISLLSFCSIPSKGDKYIKGIFLVLIFFLIKELFWDYILFKNLLPMFVDNAIADSFIFLLTYLFLNDSRRDS